MSGLMISPSIAVRMVHLRRERRAASPATAAVLLGQLTKERLVSGLMLRLH